MFQNATCASGSKCFICFKSVKYSKTRHAPKEWICVKTMKYLKLKERINKNLNPLIVDLRLVSDQACLSPMDLRWGMLVSDEVCLFFMFKRLLKNWKPWLFKIKCCCRLFSYRLEFKDYFAELAQRVSYGPNQGIELVLTEFELL